MTRPTGTSQCNDFGISLAKGSIVGDGQVSRDGAHVGKTIDVFEVVVAIDEEILADIGQAREAIEIVSLQGMVN